jgi:hypothetical protein
MQFTPVKRAMQFTPVTRAMQETKEDTMRKPRKMLWRQLSRIGLSRKLIRYFDWRETKCSQLNPVSGLPKLEPRRLRQQPRIMTSENPIAQIEDGYITPPRKSSTHPSKILS